MHLKLIACEILYREFCAAIARSIHRIDVEFLPKGLHDIGQAGMSDRLMEVVGAIDESPYDAILLGYGLCNHGIVGLSARSIPLVVPRAHDCITLFFGSKERYLEYFRGNPGVYFETSGWIERGEGLTQSWGELTDQISCSNPTYEDLVAKYGEDNAGFLFEQLTEMTRNYGKMTFIEMGIEPDDRFEQQARRKATEREWKFEKLAGDMSLVRSLLDGPWDDDRFLVVEPGNHIAAGFDEGIIKAESDR